MLTQQIGNNRPDGNMLEPVLLRIDKWTEAVKAIPGQLVDQGGLIKTAYETGAYQWGGLMLVAGLFLGYVFGTKQAAK
jgi:hypothetical protein